MAVKQNLTEKVLRRRAPDLEAGRTALVADGNQLTEVDTDQDQVRLSASFSAASPGVPAASRHLLIFLDQEVSAWSGRPGSHGLLWGSLGKPEGRIGGDRRKSADTDLAFLTFDKGIQFGEGCVVISNQLQRKRAQLLAGRGQCNPSAVAVEQTDAQPGLDKLYGAALGGLGYPQSQCSLPKSRELRELQESIKLRKGQPYMHRLEPYVRLGASDEGQQAAGTWHRLARHVCEFQIVVMMKGWARFMYDGKSTLVEAGDVVHQQPGLVHYLYDYSADMEYLEIVSPADFKTVDAPPASKDVPPITPWT